jgi:hypothetical protein
MPFNQTVYTGEVSGWLQLTRYVGRYFKNLEKDIQIFLCTNIFCADMFSMGQEQDLSQVKRLLLEHRRSFLEAKKFADITGHTVPSDTKSWSQILASLLTGKKGLFRQKGSDMEIGECLIVGAAKKRNRS